MKVGEFYRHSSRAEWGVGVVVGCDAVSCDIAFENAGRKKIALKAISVLEAVDPSTIDQRSPLLDPTRWQDVARPPDARRTRCTDETVCDHCTRPLRSSQYSADRAWKSCPSCSARDGVHHVFHRYPAGFGQSEDRESEASPDGPQSWCEDCRAGRPPQETSLRCTQVERLS